MNTATATAVTGERKHNAALTSGGIPFGKPTDAELARFQRVMATLYEKMGSRCLGWVADMIQDVADGQGAEFLKTFKISSGALHSADGLPDGLLPKGKTVFEEMPIYLGQESVSRPMESVRVGYNGEWVETKRDLVGYNYAQEFRLEINFASTYLQKIVKCGAGTTLRDCRSMIFDAGCFPEGYLRFLACLFALNKWPASWRRILRDDDEEKNKPNRIVFVGSTVTLIDDPTRYYPGFIRSNMGLGSYARPQGMFVIPMLFPEFAVLDDESVGEYFFVFTKK